MADNASGNSAATLIDGSFCDTYFDVASILAYVAAGFLIVGLLVGLAAAVVGLFRRPAQPDPNITTTSEAFLEALKGLIEALSAAPAWLGMFGAGLLLFWAIGDVAPDNCKGLAAEIATNSSQRVAPAKPVQPASNAQGTAQP
jgi:hypothetical protein